MNHSIRYVLAESFETGKLEQALRPFDHPVAAPAGAPAPDKPARNVRLEKEADSIDARAAALFVAGLLAIVAGIVLA